MAYERKPNTGTFWPTKPGAKCDLTCKINLDGVDYVLFGMSKRVNVSGRTVDIIEISGMRDKNAPPPPRSSNPDSLDVPQRSDLPF
jgi:hypothetical protein